MNFDVKPWQFWLAIALLSAALIYLLYELYDSTRHIAGEIR